MTPERLTLIKTLWAKHFGAAMAHFEKTSVYRVAPPPVINPSFEAVGVTSHTFETFDFHHETADPPAPPGHGRVVCEGVIVHQY